MKAALEQVLELALGTPEIGVVNLRVLHVFLREILNQLNLSNKEIFVPEEGSVNWSPFVSEQSYIDSGVSETGGVGRIPSPDGSSKETSARSFVENARSPKYATLNSAHKFKSLEDKVLNLEGKLAFLEDVPQRDGVVKWMREKETSPSMAKDMWHYVNLERRVGGIEDGTAKLSALVDSILLEIKLFEKYRDNQAGMDQRLKQLETDVMQMTELQQNSRRLLDGLDRLQELEKSREEFLSLLKQVERMKMEMVSRDDLEKQYVRWDKLGEALNAYRKIPEKGSYYFTPANKYQVQEFDKTSVEQTLGEVGALLDSNKEVAKDMELMKELLDRKANLEDLDKLVNSSVFADLDKQVTELNNSMNDIKTWRQNSWRGREVIISSTQLNNDVQSQYETAMLEDETLKEIKKLVRGMEQDITRLEGTCRGIMDQQNKNKIRITELDSLISDLSERKADAGEMTYELSKKADKCTFDHLVTRSKFDSSIDKMDDDLQLMNKRLNEHEETCDNTTLRLVKDVESKLDKAELEVLRDYLAKMLKAMKHKMVDDEDQAAGFRKGLMQFNCISCNRPVNFGQNGVVQSTQYQNLSGRPHTAGRQGRTNISDCVPVNFRSCGGVHTSSVPPKKITAKLNSYIQGDEETIPLSSARSEVDIQGYDGRYYKGRLDKNLEGAQEDSVKQGHPSKQMGKTAHLVQRPGSASPPGEASIINRRLRAKSASCSPRQSPDIILRTSRQDQLQDV